MKSIYLYISIFFLFSLSACKKEYPALPYTDILAFSVKDANGAQLKAVIENNEIILYWPVGQAIPQEITPSITVADKASILPLAGTKVSFNESVTYTVTAENGTVTTYKLKPIVNSLIPMISAFYGPDIYKNKRFLRSNRRAQLSGDLFDVEEGKTKVFFVNTSGQDIPVKINEITPIAVILDPDFAIGNYQSVKVISGNKTVLFKDNFEVIADPKPVVLTEISVASTVKRNGQFMIAGGENLDKVNAVVLYNSITKTFIPINLKSTTANSLTLEIPANFPLGDCNRIRYFYPDADYYAAGYGQLDFLSFPITVVE
ncbi:putative glycoside hydrolase [compost metagenome]